MEALRNGTATLKGQLACPKMSSKENEDRFQNFLDECLSFSAQRKSEEEWLLNTMR